MKKDLMVIIPTAGKGKCPECEGKMGDCECEDEIEIEDDSEDDLGLDTSSDSEEIDDLEDISLDGAMSGLDDSEDEVDEDALIMQALKDDDIVTFDSELRKRFDKWFKEKK